MAEDKIKREKKKKKIEENIYALDFNFGDEPSNDEPSNDKLSNDETTMEKTIGSKAKRIDIMEREYNKEYEADYGGADYERADYEETDDEEIAEDIYDISRGIQEIAEDGEMPIKKKNLSKIEEGIKSSKIGAKRGRKPKVKSENATEVKTAKTRKNKKDTISRQSAIKMHTEDNLTEIKLKENIYKIELQKTEYNIYTEPSETSYIIVREPCLRMVAGTAYILLEKQGDDYLVKTNQDFKINYLIDNLERKDKIVNFKLTNLTQIEANEDGLIFEIDEEKIIENTLEDNKTLVISEEDGKVYLPYTKDEIKEEMSQQKGVKIGELIEEKYILPLDKYKNSMKARFREGYNLMRKKEGKSRKSAIMLGFELMFETNLHPAIISACKNLEELDIYLDCLEDNELEKFSCFKIIYKSLPTIRKTKKMQEF